MADEKVTQKVTVAAPTQTPKRFVTSVEEAPKPKPPALSEKTRAEQAAGRSVLDAYRPTVSDEE